MAFHYDIHHVSGPVADTQLNPASNEEPIKKGKMSGKKITRLSTALTSISQNFKAQINKIRKLIAHIFSDRTNSAESSKKISVSKEPPASKTVKKEQTVAHSPRDDTKTEQGIHIEQFVSPKILDSSASVSKEPSAPSKSHVQNMAPSNPVFTPMPPKGPPIVQAEPPITDMPHPSLSKNEMNELNVEHSPPSDIKTSPYNHGKIGRNEAERELKDQPLGTALLRESNTQNDFVISYVKNNQFIHVLLQGRTLEQILTDIQRGQGIHIKQFVSPKILDSRVKELNSTSKKEQSQVELEERTSPSEGKYDPSSKEPSAPTQSHEGLALHTPLSPLKDKPGVDTNSQETVNLEEPSNRIDNKNLMSPENPVSIFKRVVNKIIEQNKAEEKERIEKLQRAVQTASKLGMGASKGAQPMAPHYWGEVIHDSNYYGRDVHVLMNIWKNSPTEKRNFNTWLDDLASGLDVPGKDQVPNHFFKDGKLNISKVQFLNENERKNFEVQVDKGLISTHNLPHPTTQDSPHIFVVAPDNKVYVGIYDRGKFNHSSFLSGGSVLGAGELTIKEGKITEITDKSGHYKPSIPMVMRGLEALIKSGADLTNTTLIIGRLTNEPKSYNALDFYNKHKLSDADKANAEKSFSYYNSLPELTSVQTRETLANQPQGTFLLRKGSLEGSLVYATVDQGQVRQNRYLPTEIPWIFKDEHSDARLNILDFMPK